VCIIHHSGIDRTGVEGGEEEEGRGKKEEEEEEMMRYFFFFLAQGVNRLRSRR